MTRKHAEPISPAGGKASDTWASKPPKACILHGIGGVCRHIAPGRCAGRAVDCILCLGR
jgi:hypothetical protein